jgi:hypothetical protein
MDLLWKFGTNRNPNSKGRNPVRHRKANFPESFTIKVSSRLETFSKVLATNLSLYALDNCSYTSDSLGSGFSVGVHHSWVYSRPVGRGYHYHYLAPGQWRTSRLGYHNTKVSEVV